MTEYKKELIAENMNPIFKFIKEEYVLKKLPLRILKKNLYQQYVKYCDIKKLKSVGEYEFSRKMAEKGLPNHKSTGGYFGWTLTADELYQVYQKNHWLHKEDEIHEYKNDNESKIEFLEGKEEALKENEEEKALKEIEEDNALKKIEKEKELKKVEVKVKEKPKEEKDNWEDIQEINKEKENILNRNQLYGKECLV